MSELVEERRCVLRPVLLQGMKTLANKEHQNPT